MIKDLSFDLFDVVNKVTTDKFGRVSAFLAINKPIGITSHDIVDKVRKKLGTKKVGHAGALDPFASGVVLTLVGKRYTRLAEDLIKLDKRYRADVLFGVTTDTLDVEGYVTQVSDTSVFDFDRVPKVLKSFEGTYEQFVPVFSSVKVQGNKLRVLARKSSHFEFFAQEGEKWVRFFMGNQEDGSAKIVELPLPHKPVKISDVSCSDKATVSFDSLTGVFTKTETEIPNTNALPRATVEFDCSKGTYVRQFAYDLAQELDQVGMLIGLERTRVGAIGIDQCIDIESL
ncbi:hypothetical protein KC717_00080 [Candidatus Dojkabacteria bacterium]|uniref:tRNA pseudouridine synthase B n=1 Tax=Candidatus Dojkabacteria bacterium TaxID=2099670 RepID=A0A955L728_9BACT|nr:hypothetical protein [Candidatus Dojkabacteria bacterium]